MIDDEIKACFRENPELVQKSLYEIARWFYIQGELRYSSLREVLSSKTNYFRCRLYDINAEAGAEADKHWSKAAEILNIDDKPTIIDINERRNRHE